MIKRILSSLHFFIVLSFCSVTTKLYARWNFHHLVPICTPHLPYLVFRSHNLSHLTIVFAGRTPGKARVQLGFLAVTSKFRPASVAAAFTHTASEDQRQCKRCSQWIIVAFSALKDPSGRDGEAQELPFVDYCCNRMIMEWSSDAWEFAGIRIH